MPRNFFHFVIHHGTQFTGMSNLPVPGERPVDFAGMARCAGYANAQKIAELHALEEDIEGILASIGPTFIELEIEPDAASLTASNPQKDWADLQFTRMGDEARQLTKWLESK